MLYPALQCSAAVQQCSAAQHSAVQCSAGSAPVMWPSTFRKAGKSSSCSPTTKPCSNMFSGQHMGAHCTSAACGTLLMQITADPASISRCDALC